MSWPLVALKDCCRVVSGGTPKTDMPEYWGGPHYWVTPKDLSSLNSIYIKETPERITDSGLKNSSAEMLPIGSVLFSSRAPIGHIAITSTAMCTNQGFKSFIPGKSVDALYLYFCLKRYTPELQVLGNGATFKEVSKRVVEEYKIPLPPLATQQHIARVLEQADWLCKQAQQMERELNQLAQSLFLEMFGDPVANPKRWTTIPYADLCHRITVGIVVKPSDYYVEHGVPALRSLNIRENKIVKENFVYFSEANNVGLLKKTRVYKGDVVLVRSGQPGTAAVVPEELDGVNAIDILISTPIREKVAPHYLAFFFNSSGGKKIVGASQRGQIQKHLNVGSLESALIPVPPLSLQEEFVRQLDAIANVRGNVEANLESMNMTFDSLMQRAFNGELTAPARKAA